MDNNELTEKQALENCKKMWEYIAATGEINKTSAFNRLWPELPLIKFDCWACEFSSDPESEFLDCTKCPLWPAESSSKTAMYGCELNDSPYMDWCRHKNKSAALEIAQMCDDALAKLEDKENE